MRVKNPLRLCGELSLRNVLGRGSAALGLIVLAFPGGEDGSRPERKKFLGQIFYCPAYCIGNDMIAVGGKDKGKGMKDKTVIVIRDRVRKARFENSQNVKMAAISLRRRIGTSGLIWVFGKLASIWLRLRVGTSSARRQAAMDYRRYLGPCPIFRSPTMRPFHWGQGLLLRRSAIYRPEAV